MRYYTILLLIVVVFGKGSSGGGGRSSGYGGGGTSKSRNIRSSTHSTNSGYRTSSTMWIYTWLVLNGHRRNSYLHNRDPKELKMEGLFDCGNGINIRESQVCDWIDDCGNGVDERIPLPCEGEYSQQEFIFYIGMTLFYFIWIVVIFLLDKISKIKEGEHVDEFRSRRMRFKLMNIVPILLFIINIIFLFAAYIGEKSIIIQYYITNCVFIAIGVIISLCIRIKTYLLIWVVLLILAVTTMYHGSTVFSSIPNNLLRREYYSNITTNINNSIINYTNFTEKKDIYPIMNLLKEDGLWQTNTNESAYFTIDIGKNISLGIVSIYPTYPYRSTNTFQICTSLDQGNWTTRISGPMPIVKTKSALEVIISDNGIPTRYIKFIGYPNSTCNLTTNECKVGLDELRIYSLPYIKIN